MQQARLNKLAVLMVCAALCCMQGAALGDEQEGRQDPGETGSSLSGSDQLEKKMATLSQLGYHPFLMPLIMENRDAIGLSNEQVAVFREWRSKYRVPLLHAMNRILEERIWFQRIALNPKTAEEVLLTKQAEIFRLQKQVLNYQLSCRRTILDTFTDEQWDNFSFILTENGYVLD